MGVMSRKVLPACGNLCFFCPALRARSRQPVKRYKKLLSDIFPKSQKLDCKASKGWFLDSTHLKQTNISETAVDVSKGTEMFAIDVFLLILWLFMPFFLISRHFLVIS